MTYEGDSDRTSQFTGSRSLGGYVSWGAPKHCSTCGVQKKFYQLYKTTRTWEEEYCEQDQCYRKRKCTDCELQERRNEDVDRSWSMFEIE